MSCYITICERAAEAAGELLLQKIGQVQVREKGPADLVTEADLAAQELITGIILDEFPDHIVVGEEDRGHSGNAQVSDYRWIVDPLDGTTNYAHGVPHYSVSIALEHRGELLVGVVFNPSSGECFSAISGEGACLNGNRIYTSSVSKLSEALVAIGFPPKAASDSADVNAFLEAISRCQAMRRTGSAALNLCYLAMGRFDAGWCFSTKPWDVAAGALIIKEAGGIVTRPDGSQFSVESADFAAASTKPLHAELRNMLTKCFK